MRNHDKLYMSDRTQVERREAKLVIDYRERALADKLTEQKFQFVSKKLDVADIEIWCGDRLVFIIERKTVGDYINCMSTQRLKNQLFRMQTLSQSSGARIIILVEGTFLPQFGSNLTEVPMHLYNSLLNRMLVEKFPVIRSETVGETVTWISKIMEKIEDFIKEPVALSGEGETPGLCYMDTLKVKKSENVDANNCFLLQLRQIPGVSLNIATTIQSHYASFPKLIDAYRASQNEKSKESMLAKIPLGQRTLGPVLSKRIYQYLMV